MCISHLHHFSIKISHIVRARLSHVASGYRIKQHSFSGRLRGKDREGEGGGAGSEMGWSLGEGTKGEADLPSRAGPGCPDMALVPPQCQVPWCTSETWLEPHDCRVTLGRHRSR